MPPRPGLSAITAASFRFGARNAALEATGAPLSLM